MYLHPVYREHGCMNTHPPSYPQPENGACMNSGKLSRMPNQPRTPIRGVRIPDDLWDEAKLLAARDGTSVSEVVRKCLAHYVDKNRTCGD